MSINRKVVEYTKVYTMKPEKKKSNNCIYYEGMVSRMFFCFCFCLNGGVENV